MSDSDLVLCTEAEVRACAPPGAYTTGCKPGDVLRLAGKGFTLIQSTGACGTPAAPLRKLDVSDNKLSRLSGLHKLEALTWLTATNNALTGQSLVDVSHMKSLVMLSLGHNSIATIPAGALKGQAENLRALVLNHNKISDVSPLLHLKGVTTFIFSHNKLASLPAPFAFPELCKISLGSNAFTTVPDLTACPRLAELRLNANQITTLPASVSSLAALRLLDLSTNQISSWEALEALRPLVKLRNLNLAGNPLERAALEEDVNKTAYFARLRALCPGLSVIDGKRFDDDREARREAALAVKRTPSTRTRTGSDADADAAADGALGKSRRGHPKRADGGKAPRGDATRKPHHRERADADEDEARGRSERVESGHKRGRGEVAPTAGAGEARARTDRRDKSATRKESERVGSERPSSKRSRKAEDEVAVGEDAARASGEPKRGSKKSKGDAEAAATEKTGTEAPAKSKHKRKHAAKNGEPASAPAPAPAPAVAEAEEKSKSKKSRKSKKAAKEAEAAAPIVLPSLSTTAFERALRDMDAENLVAPKKSKSSSKGEAAVEVITHTRAAADSAPAAGAGASSSAPNIAAAVAAAESRRNAVSAWDD